MNLIETQKGIKFDFQDNKIFFLICGQHNKNLCAIEQVLNISIDSFGNQITINGKKENVEIAVKLIRKLHDKIKNKENKLGEVQKSDIENTLNEIENEKVVSFFENEKKPFAVTWKKTIFPKNSGQEEYCKTLLNKDMVFGLGPAGTGKSYLAVAIAIDFLKKNLIDKIVLSRPAVEAGEKLGFLPGDMKEKVDPYLRPLYDALYEMMPSDKVEKMFVSGKIEIAPVAFMRGRTLSNAFIIIDEAQNTTPVQMKMILTRLGKNSKMVITGDLSQIDLPKGQSSGLLIAIQKLKKIDSIGFVNLNFNHTVRHPIVQKILKAYEN